MNQVVEMTYQEKYDMYMAVPKEDIVKMLINCNDMLDGLTPIITYDVMSDCCNDLSNRYWDKLYSKCIKCGTLHMRYESK